MKERNASLKMEILKKYIFKKVRELRFVSELSFMTT